MKQRSVITLNSLGQLRCFRSGPKFWLGLQVERQIDQMVKFIKQEADEKANEIAVSAEEVTRDSNHLMHAISMLQAVWQNIVAVFDTGTPEGLCADISHP